MQSFRCLAVAVIVAAAAAGCRQQPEGDSASQNVSQAGDPFLWLEDVRGQKSMDWVKQQNAKALSVLAADADYRSDYGALLTALDATDRIPFGTLDHQHAFNFWQDATHPKGVWRRADITDYVKPEPRRKRIGSGRMRTVRLHRHAASFGCRAVAATRWWSASSISHPGLSSPTVLRFPKRSRMLFTSTTTPSCSTLISERVPSRIPAIRAS